MSRYFYLFVCFLLYANNAFSQFYPDPYKKPLIVIDPGHGGLDRGAKIKTPFCEEKRIALNLAFILKKDLEKMGYRVKLTRSKDYFVPLKKRVVIANQARSEIFISLHFNSCPSSLPNGIEIYYHDSREHKKKALASKRLASSILTSVVAKTRAGSRGVKRGEFVVIKETDMPSILIEGGFLTNPRERDALRKRSYLEKLGKSIADGIDRFFKLNRNVLGAS